MSLQETAKRSDIIEPIPPEYDLSKIAETIPEDEFWSAAYWHNFARSPDLDPAAVSAAQRNADKSEKLHYRLLSYASSQRGEQPSGDTKIDKLSPSQTAKEWYLGIGSFNTLENQDCYGDLSIAAVTLWSETLPDKYQELSFKNKSQLFEYEIDKISLTDPEARALPKRWQTYMDTPDKVTQLENLGMVGQILTDISRLPIVDRLNYDSQEKTIQRAFNVNSAIVNGLKAKNLTGQNTQYEDRLSRVLSDALKAKYDTWFAWLDLRYKGNENSQDYKVRYKRALQQELLETITVAGGEISNGKVVDLTDFQDVRNDSLSTDPEFVQSKMRQSKLKPGDLLENYYNALMRYHLNLAHDTQHGQYRFIVQTATRRQDEPHDGFNGRDLSSYAFDVKIIDRDKTMPDKIFQLKTHRLDNQTYIDGIKVLDNILAGHGNKEQRRDILNGTYQLYLACSMRNHFKAS